MSERIRVEVTEATGSYTTTYAAEAISGADAVNALVEAIDEYEGWVDDE